MTGKRSDRTLFSSNSGEHHYPDSVVHPGIPIIGVNGDLLSKEAGEAREGTSQEEELRSGSRRSEPRPLQSCPSLR